MTKREADLEAKNAKLKDRAASLERRRSALERANRSLVAELNTAKGEARRGKRLAWALGYTTGELDVEYKSNPRSVNPYTEDK